MSNIKLLSICVPVYNRLKLFDRLLHSIKTKNPFNIELVVINDGSSDNIFSSIKKFKKKNNKIRVKYIFQKNSGVAHAILKAYKYSSGMYCIKMDTDDVFVNKGIDFILNEINNKKKILQTNKKICGIVFGTIIKNTKNINNRLPKNIITNFLSLRADLKIKYDCKEVVKTNLILKNQFKIPKKNRVVQQSWFLMANKFDCLTSSFIVAKKEYFKDGLSRNAGINYKIKEASILESINSQISNSNRYKSILFKIKCLVLRQKYAMHSKKKIFKNIIDITLFPVCLLIFIYDKILFFIANKNNMKNV